MICVSQSTDPLPTDTATLQALLLGARAERDAVVAERDHLQSQNVRLQHLLRQLQRAQFGPRSEKLDPDQLHLAFEDIEQAIAATEADDDKRDRSGRVLAPRSVGSIAVRFPLICRAFM